MKTTLSGLPPEPGMENAGAPQPINPLTGQNRDYWVLSPEELAKGFVRPVRDSYLHVGPVRPTSLRDLTEEEKLRNPYYVKFEPNENPKSPVLGKYWTQDQLDRLGGCGAVTRMDHRIAVTYARDPKFYGATFCCHCGGHFPVEEFLWEGTFEKVGS